MKKALLAATVVASALTASLVAAPAATASGFPRDRDGRDRSAIPFTEATVTAGADGSFTLDWKARGTKRVEIKANGKVVAKGGAQGRAVVTGLPAADRQWFDFTPDHGRGLHLADRLIKLDGAVNFRDAGGYRTTTGQWVKMGEVYRSDALDKLTANDLAKLQRLRVKTVFDLRMADERTQAADKVPAGASYVVADVFAGSGSFQALPRTPDEAVKAMTDAERAMVAGEGGKKAYTQVFEGIQRDRARSVLFHCTAGKDRTGWANASLLTALGVPRETVEADYLASNDYRKAANDAVLSHLPAQQAAVYKPLLDVRPEYLNAGYAEVKARYGTFDRYLKDGLGIDSRELRELKRDLLVG
ncbi:tyrosine-protein phosphatase [Streptomyces subrutilus]|uniref:Protein-tyrosine-phosphatase n=1 Tax=Streptomyces subrutilus TaxID=36818 RepID=A0A5P2UMS3_9ACTN|nr:tyrosine-protein phosphatase [Streptomyces subrutilus]QEU80180.1 tyrosine-protein phosphatase [Streptomyces subrutilus]WSJ30548.1 tyrosine-protein phosphatase [Streptomyces subrutilus]GGZ49921.1 protein-tyrosine-phosphatase [Streptomyces subrutilus]